MGQIVDTSVIVNIERRNAPLEELLSLGADDEMAIAAVAVAELLVGVQLMSGEAEHADQEAYVDGIRQLIPIIAFDASVAAVYARLLVELRQRGTMIGTHDLQIAATALSLGYAVLTDNPRDFERVPGLEVRRPSWHS